MEVEVISVGVREKGSSIGEENKDMWVKVTRNRVVRDGVTLKWEIMIKDGKVEEEDHE